MSQFLRASVLGMLAATGCLWLSGCGASVGGKKITGPTGPYDTPQNSAAYQQAIQRFLSASTQGRANTVQALMFRVLTQGQPDFSDFMSNILPNVSGVAVGLQWSQIETTQGVYDFSAFDASLQPFVAAGKQVNLIVWPATEGGNNDPNRGGSTPAYVFTPAWAATVGAPNPLDMTVCQNFTGDSSNPFYNSAVDGGGGSWNVNSDVPNAGDLSGLPVSYEAPFVVGYKNFIVAVIEHYNHPGGSVPQVGYIRFGFSQGGENSPECNQYWPGYSETTYVNYVQSMTDFVKSQNPAMVILEDLHAVGGPGQADDSYADAEAADAATNRFGFGTNGLQKSDISNFAAGLPCDSDWCQMFIQYPTPVPAPIHSLQTLQWSDPTDQMQTGSLATLNGGEGLIPFAQAHGANNLELYLADLALAYSPNYCSYEHAVC